MTVSVMRVAAGGVLVIVLSGDARLAAATTIVSDEQASQKVMVRDVRVRDGAVTGLIVNGAHKPLRDVRLMIRHRWLWADERHPGEDDPGRVGYHSVHEQIPPEVSAQFSYRPDPPLPLRSDGHFETTVEVVGYSEVGD